jgi:hypothetical protein
MAKGSRRRSASARRYHKRQLKEAREQVSQRSAAELDELAQRDGEGWVPPWIARARADRQDERQA